MTEFMGKRFGISTAMIAFTHSVKTALAAGLDSSMVIRHNVPRPVLEQHDGLNLDGDVIIRTVLRGRDCLPWIDVDFSKATPVQKHRLKLDERLGFGAGISFGGRFGGIAGGYCICLAARHDDEAAFHQRIAPHIPDVQKLMTEFSHSMRRSMIASRLKITPRQQDVLELASSGLTSAGIAKQLGISGRTVEHTLERARISLGAATTAEAVAKAIVYELIG